MTDKHRGSLKRNQFGLPPYRFLDKVQKQYLGDGIIAGASTTLLFNPSFARKMEKFVKEKASQMYLEDFAAWVQGYQQGVRLSLGLYALIFISFLIIAASGVSSMFLILPLSFLITSYIVLIVKMMTLDPETGMRRNKINR